MFNKPEAEKGFKPSFKFKLRLKYGWFHLNLYSIFQDLSRRSLKPVLGDLRHGLNSLNSNTELFTIYKNLLFYDDMAEKSFTSIL